MCGESQVRDGGDTIASTRDARATRTDPHCEYMMRRLLVYVLLVAGSLIFAWPFVWMIGTSIKLEREVLSNRSSVLPERPIPRSKSPYLDDRLFVPAGGPHRDEAIAIVEEQLRGHIWPSSIDPEFARKQTARGIYQRLLMSIPYERWSDSSEQLRATLTDAVTPELIDSVFGELRRVFAIGQLRARSTELQEDQLVSASDAATKWSVAGPGALSQKVDRAEFSYDFSSANKVTLSQTFATSFPIERLRRLQLYFQPDDTWHALRVTVEKLGQRFVSERAVYLADQTWQVVTWQERSADDSLTKIKTWTLLKDGGKSAVRGPNEVRIRLELNRTSVLGAWLAKIWRNYRLTLDYIPFWRYVGTGLFLVILNLIGTLFSCSLAAYAFARLRWPGRGICFAALLGTMMIPAQVTMIPQFLIMQKLGWYNTLKPLWVMSFFGSAFSIFLLRQFLKGIPRDLEDAARLDGCGFLRIYWHIMLPLVRPTLAVIAIFTFLATWNDFMGPLIYLSDQRLYPLSFGLYAFQIQSLQPGTSAGIGMLMAGSLLMMMPVIAIFFFAQRYFLQGVTLTGMKG
jgi:multiple sugar transport system permease protein